MTQPAKIPEGMPPPGGAYAKYVLAVLFLVYILNFVDRQILSILNEAIRADLGLTDAQLGFLYGTAFAVFYAIFGLPLGRLADVWNRTRLIAVGLSFWSAMTALSGMAQNFGQLMAARIGVGVGEASASPAAYSLLSDWFESSKRATVMAVYASGIYVGVGLSLGLGGWIVDSWEGRWQGDAPMGLAGWQVAFFVVGAPGILLALLVATLKEPVRGMSDGVFTPPEPHPFRIFFRELRCVLPPLTLYQLWVEKAGAAGIALNLVAAAGIAAGAYGLVQLTGSAAQWYALAFGLYASFSWCQSLYGRDKPCFELIFRTPSFGCAAAGFGFLSFVTYGIGYWTPPFFIREHGISSAEAGMVLGGTAAAAGFLGVILGGWLADWLRARYTAGRLIVCLFVGTAPVPLALIVFTTDNLLLAYLLNFPMTLITTMWIGPGVSTLQDLVLPRMRGISGAMFILAVTFIGLALGPYLIGLASTLMGGNLPAAILMALGAEVLALVLLLIAISRLGHDEATLLERARRAGESVVAGPAPPESSDATR